MAQPRLWSSLSPAYRKRLRRAGVTPQRYNAIQRTGNKGALKAARGHAETPERPSRVATAPHRYQAYVARNVERRPELAPYLAPEPPPQGRPTVDRETGSPLSLSEHDNEIVVATINPVSGVLILETFDTRTRQETRQELRFDPAEFPTIIKHIRSLHYVVTVTSDPI